MLLTGSPLWVPDARDNLIRLLIIRYWSAIITHSAFLTHLFEIVSEFHNWPYSGHPYQNAPNFLNIQSFQRISILNQIYELTWIDSRT
jgi:hypothetical protein